MVRPPRGEPSQAGWRNEGAENPLHFQRHSYSGHPCSNRPILSEAIPRLLCALGEVGLELDRPLIAGRRLLQPSLVRQRSAPRLLCASAKSGWSWIAR